MITIEENSYLNAEDADRLRIALGRPTEGKAIHPTWVLSALASSMTRQEIEEAIEPHGFKVNWSKVRYARSFKKSA